jgi:hypothetical protein
VSQLDLSAALISVEQAIVIKFAAAGLDGNALLTLAQAPDWAAEFFPVFGYLETGFYEECLR